MLDPILDPIKLRKLAQWFDAKEGKHPEWSGDRTVQADLRRIANALEYIMNEKNPNDIIEIHLAAYYKRRGDTEMQRLVTPRFCELGEALNIPSIVLVGAHDILTEIENRQKLLAKKPSAAVRSEKALPKYKHTTTNETVWALKIRYVTCHASGDPAVTIEEFAKTDQFQGGHIFPIEASYLPLPFDAAFYRTYTDLLLGGNYYVTRRDGSKFIVSASEFEANYAITA